MGVDRGALRWDPPVVSDRADANQDDRVSDRMFKKQGEEVVDRRPEPPAHRRHPTGSANPLGFAAEAKVQADSKDG
jgi:hypothetical protein